MKSCKRCGRKLKTKKSIEVGLGPVCYRKFMTDQAEIGFADQQVTIDELIKEEASESMSLTFTIPGRPIPAVRMTRRSKHVNKYAKRYLAYKGHVGWIARQNHKGLPADGPIGIEISLYIHGGNAGDIDNYAKAITDGLNKIVYDDDKQITYMLLHKNRVKSKDDQRVEVEVYALQDVA